VTDWGRKFDGPPGVGLGETIRLESPAVVGSGLAVGDELVRLAAIATTD
jgi:hypothetical protein